METAEITRKKAKLQELCDTENEVNKQIRHCEGTINRCLDDIKQAKAKKQKLCKRVSHNMKLRNKILSEIKVITTN